MTVILHAFEKVASEGEQNEQLTLEIDLMIDGYSSESDLKHAIAEHYRENCGEDGDYRLANPKFILDDEDEMNEILEDWDYLDESHIDLDAHTIEVEDYGYAYEYGDSSFWDYVEALQTVERDGYTDEYQEIVDAADEAGVSLDKVLEAFRGTANSETDYAYDYINMHCDTSSVDYLISNNIDYQGVWDDLHFTLENGYVFDNDY